MGILNAYDAGRLLPTRTMVLDRRENIPAPSMQRHTMRVVLVIKCIKLVLDAIRDWASVILLNNQETLWGGFNK